MYCHPSVSVVMAKLFQTILVSGVVPDGFKHSYIVPVPIKSRTVAPKQCIVMTSEALPLVRLFPKFLSTVLLIALKIF